MPRISAFYGIVIAMYFDDHSPAHFHAKYGEYGHRLRLTFADGLIGDVDLAERFAGPVGPMFEPLRDADYFARVGVDEELGTIVWPNGADLAPDVLHEQAMSLA